MKIVFMGTPDFSVPCLKAILDAGHEVLAVFSQPDKPRGRKMVLTPPPVKEFAAKNGIAVYQPATLKDKAAFDIIKKLSPEVIVVVAYGKILPDSILSLPKYGCVNVHASLLPKHRGASPIQWCIVKGDTQTGVCTMQMDSGMDTGDILECAKTPIGENETGEELFSRLSDMGAKLIVSTLEKLKEGTVTPKKQNGADATYAPIIKREMGQLDFTKPALEVHNLIRGFYSWPATYFTLGGKRYKVYSARLSGRCGLPAGTVAENSDRLVVACGDGMGIEILTIQPEGSRIMTAGEFLAGHGIKTGTVLESAGVCRD